MDSVRLASHMAGIRKNSLPTYVVRFSSCHNVLIDFVWCLFADKVLWFLWKKENRLTQTIHGGEYKICSTICSRVNSFMVAVCMNGEHMWIPTHTHTLFESSRSIENHHENGVDYSFVVWIEDTFHQLKGRAFNNQIICFLRLGQT